MLEMESHETQQHCNCLWVRKNVTIGYDWTKRTDEVAELPSPLMVKGVWHEHTTTEEMQQEA